MSEQILLNNIVVDLETWDTGDDAVIVSIGAARLTNKFDLSDPLAPAGLNTFYAAIDPEQHRYGRTIGAGTVLWWMAPERTEARELWLKSEKVDLFEALDGFATWCQFPAISVEIPFDPVKVVAEPIMFGNGAVFDNVKLRRAMEACGIDYPAKFYNDLCYRSIVRTRLDIKRVRHGTHHDARDDAITELLHMVAVAPQMFAVS